MKNHGRHQIPEKRYVDSNFDHFFHRRSHTLPRYHWIRISYFTKFRKFVENILPCFSKFNSLKWKCHYYEFVVKNVLREEDIEKVLCERFRIVLIFMTPDLVVKPDRSWTGIRPFLSSRTKLSAYENDSWKLYGTAVSYHWCPDDVFWWQESDSTYERKMWFWN